MSNFSVNVITFLFFSWYRYCTTPHTVCQERNGKSVAETRHFYAFSTILNLHIRHKERAAPPREIPIQNRSVLDIYLFLPYHISTSFAVHNSTTGGCESTEIIRGFAPYYSQTFSFFIKSNGCPTLDNTFPYSLSKLMVFNSFKRTTL